MDDPDAPSVASEFTASLHLADEVRRRRDALGLTQEQVAERANMPVNTFSAVEGAKRKSYRATTLAGVDRGLDWLPGTAGRILGQEGFRPDEPDRPTVDALEAVTDVIRELVDAVRDLRREPSLPAQLAEIWQVLSDEDRATILQLAMRLRNTHHPNSGGAAGGG